MHTADKNKSIPWKSFLFRTILPTVLTIVLFLSAILFIIIPTIEKSSLDRKREMIQELTNSAWNILAKLAHDEQQGILTREDAQSLAIEQIKNLHYGQHMKDYFWVNDMHPRMVIHPYRTDLNGKDLTTYTDPNGKYVFVEFVNVVNQKGSGYVEYMWQWKDDKTRIVPKISYVKGFSPWGWIIGTGIYIEDVTAEIARITRNVIKISLVILLIMTLLLSYIIINNYKTEKQRTLAESALRDSEEKYRTLVESASEGMLMAVDGKFIYSNKTVSRLLEYNQAELSQLHFDELFETDKQHPSYPTVQNFMAGKTGPENFEAQLKTKSGAIRDVILSTSEILIDGKPGIIAVVTDITKQKKAENVLGKSEEKYRTLVNNLNVGIYRGTIEKRPRFIDVNPAMIALFGCKTREELLSYSITDLYVHPEDQNEFERKAFNGKWEREIIKLRKMDGTVFFASIWAVTVYDKNGKAQHFDGIIEDVTDMLAKEKEQEKVLGEMQNAMSVLSSSMAGLPVCNDSPTLFLEEIKKANSPKEIADYRASVPYLIAALIKSSTNAGYINHLITTITDTLVVKLIDFAIEELGPPPCRFTFLVFGSEGREEQTLCTDQDNAIVFEDVPQGQEPGQENRTQAYFLTLGKKVCQWLDDAGYEYCKGNNMAQNPEWCQPVSIWEQYFTRWIAEADAENLLRVKIFFDFKTAYGEKSFEQQLREHINKVTTRHPAFFQFLARNVLKLAPPLTLFGNIALEDVKNHGKVFDIKSSLMPITDFARIYALKHRLKETNTLDRLQQLREQDVLSKQNFDEMTFAFNHLMMIRFRTQADTILNGDKNPDNYVRPRSLTYVEQKMLKEIFSQTKHFQARLSYDFTGQTDSGTL